MNFEKLPAAVLKYLALLTTLLTAWASPGQLLTNCTQVALQEALGQNGGLVLIQTCTISLSSPVIISVPEVEIRVTGTNSSITASNRARIFEVQSGSRLIVSGMTLSGGQAQAGGAVLVHEGGEAVFSNCTFTANSALGADGRNGFNGPDYWGTGGNGQPGLDGTNALGGAIYNQGSATFINCRFTSNSATAGSGGEGGTGGAGEWGGGNGGRGGNGAPARGGAIFNEGMLVISNSIIELNTVKAGDGGLGGVGGTGPNPGVAGSGGFGATAAGAGIFNIGDAIIVNSTFYTNTATGGNSAHDGTLNGGLTGGDGYDGGGAYGGAICNRWNAYVTNCTFALNRVNGGAGANGGNGRFQPGSGGNGGDAYGGGVYNSGTQWLMNCTLAENMVRGGTNGIGGTTPEPGKAGVRGKQVGASVFGARDGEFYYKNTIFSYPRGSTNGAGSGLIGMGFNLSDDSSMPLGPGGIRTNAQLVALANNGGPTPTMMLQPSSRAANRGDMEGAPEFDQRGFPRPGAGTERPDVGAVEVQGPTITNQPASITVPLGGTAVFTVRASGDLPLVYSWRKNGSKITGATSSTLTITNVTSASQGQYSVIVSNAASFVQSAIATLTIGTNTSNTNTATAPVISSQPVSQTVVPGSTVTFSVAATGTSPISVQWRSNNVSIPSGTNLTLVLTNVQVSYTADYTARLTNSAGATVSDIAHLTVTAAPAMMPVPAPGGSQFNIAFPTLPGVTYVTEFSPSLTATNWTPLTTNMGNGGMITNADILTNLPTRFYRLRAK